MYKLALIMLLLKLFGVLLLPWWLVLAPFIYAIVAFFVFVILVFWE